MYGYFYFLPTLPQIFIKDVNVSELFDIIENHSHVTSSSSIIHLTKCENLAVTLDIVIGLLHLA